MGTFNINVSAVGGHGCDRETREGGDLKMCGRLDCPDCRAADLAADMSRRYAHGDIVMQFTHWPGQTSEVVDQFTARNGYVVERKRIKGDFYKR